MFKWFKTEDGTLCNLDYAIQISVQTTNDSKFAVEAHLESRKNVVLATFNEKGIAESKMEMMFGLNAIKDLKRRD